MKILKYKNHRDLGIRLFSAIMIIAFTSCSNEDSSTEGTVRQGGLRVSIPAVMLADDTRAVTISADAATTSFSTSDRVYVYNEATRSLDVSYLTPDQNGTSVTLEGELTNTTYQTGDRLYLFYNMNAVDATNATNSSFNYSSQTGTSASAGTMDFAVATVSVKAIVNGELETTATAFFTNVQSIFRLSFSFADWNGTAIATSPTIVSLTIGSSRSSMATEYSPLKAEGSKYTAGSITLSNPDMTGDIYFTAPFDENQTDQYDDLIFTATDNNGIVYTGKKEAPLSGFMNGQYYYSSAPITLAKTTRTITVGIVSYCFDEYNWTTYSDYKVHYWGGADGAQDVAVTSLNTTETKDVGYWSQPQSFYMSSAEVPADITYFKVYYQPQNRWFGSDADASQYSKAYIFNYSTDNAYYE